METKKLKQLWHQLYGATHDAAFDQFVAFLASWKSIHQPEPQTPEWYKDAIVYSLYVDLFNDDFNGLADKLDYLDNLGVNCLWLLPVLDSPMRDAGFDISNYRKLRPELLGLSADSEEEDQQRVFGRFLDEAHQKGIRVIFDIAMNHTSDQHLWFKEACKDEDNPYHDFYIWSSHTNRYKDARIIFKGMESSNWEAFGDKYYFHRFFSFQPDLNYRNPAVLVEMCKNLLFWIAQGVDGFRVDAIPYLWKEERTNCENLPQTHAIVKFFRAVVDHVRLNTLLLAEACQKPAEVIKYFGSGDECHAGYHFPLMPQMFKAIAMESGRPVMDTLSSNVTPDIPDQAQWFTFLRCHDELSLERVYVSEEDRAFIHGEYCHHAEWDFREGEGIAARLSELMQRNPSKIALAFSIMLTLPGTPIIYYGDEFGKLNDEAFYHEKIKETGKDDTRFLVRGKIDWRQLEDDLRNHKSLSAQVYSRIRKMVQMRKKTNVFGRGNIQWVEVQTSAGGANNAILAYRRQWKNSEVLIIHNLSSQPQSFPFRLPTQSFQTDILGNRINYDIQTQLLTLGEWEFLWVE
jgi:maltose alpha-D-glucosyltransferase / alpha-amylase